MQLHYHPVLCCIALPCVTLHSIGLGCIAFHCFALYCIALHLITLQYCIGLHCVASRHNGGLWEIGAATAFWCASAIAIGSYKPSGCIALLQCYVIGIEMYMHFCLKHVALHCMVLQCTMRRCTYAIQLESRTVFVKYCSAFYWDAPQFICSYAMQSGAVCNRQLHCVQCRIWDSVMWKSALCNVGSCNVVKRNVEKWESGLN